MMTANEKFAMIGLDLPMRVFPIPSTGRLEIGDLLQWVRKMRQFGPAGQEVTIPAPSAIVVASGGSRIFRRRGMPLV